MISKVAPSYGSDPAYTAVAVTPHDTNEVKAGYLTRGVRIGGAGNLTATMADGTDVTIQDCLAGEILPIRCTIIKATGTTATKITAFY